MAGLARRSDYILAACVAVAAFIVSPLGIELITRRPDLSFRVNVISLCFTAFLALLTAAIAAQRRLRRFFLYALACVFPFAALAALEAAAVSVRFADVVAPLEDTSILADKRPWPRQLLSNSASYVTPEGFRLLRPWQGSGIVFNELGLRTAMPAPKAAGEWRVAVTGGSAAWGWNVRDRDTIPVRLQQDLRRSGHANVTVYNFGIGGTTLNQEIALLKHFRDIYAIDQVLFYTGGNDVFFDYIGELNKNNSALTGAFAEFELIKTAMRLRAMRSDPSPQLLQRLDNEIVPNLLRTNTLRDGIVNAAEYCRSANLRCDFALQPLMSERKTHPAAEAAMGKVLGRVYPRLDMLAPRMYADALAAAPAGHIFSLTHIFDRTAQPVFLDFVHLNEEGNRLAAAAVAPIVTARLP